MEAKVSWREELQFVGVADSGFPVKLDSKSSPETGIGPMEMVAVALAGCTAMDVISILQKKRQDVTGFDVQFHAERAADHPKVFSKAELEYIVVGHQIDEDSVQRAIELSLQKYCPVHTMLEKAFPMEATYSIYEDAGKEERQLVKEGKCLSISSS